MSANYVAVARVTEQTSDPPLSGVDMIDSKTDFKLVLMSLANGAPMILPRQKLVVLLDCQPVEFL